MLNKTKVPFLVRPKRQKRAPNKKNARKQISFEIRFYIGMDPLTFLLKSLAISIAWFFFIPLMIKGKAIFSRIVKSDSKLLN